MSQKLIHPSDFLEMPWANGGGTTFEIFRGVGLTAVDDDSWDWRLSMARIEKDGPFSSLPGIDRVFVSLGPDDISMTIDDDESVVRALDQRVFAGEALVSTKLLGRATTDLNLMGRRDRVVLSAQVPGGRFDVMPGDVVGLFALIDGKIGDLAVPEGSVGLLTVERPQLVTFLGGVGFRVRP